MILWRETKINCVFTRYLRSRHIVSFVWKYFHILCTVLNRNGSESLDEVQLLPISEMKRCSSLVSLRDRTTDPRPTRDSKYCRWNRRAFKLYDHWAESDTHNKAFADISLHEKGSKTRVTGYHSGVLHITFVAAEKLTSRVKINPLFNLKIKKQ